jgi:ADP-heptose:LPS heptosyltransferase
MMVVLTCADGGVAPHRAIVSVQSAQQSLEYEPDAGDRLAVTAEVWRKLGAINADIGPGRKLVILNPNGSARFPMRRLPLESFTELGRNLLADPEVFVLITGVAGEKPDAQYVRTRLGSSRVLDLTGHTTLIELLHLFDFAHVLVTNDSGLFQRVARGRGTRARNGADGLPRGDRVGPRPS